MAIMTKAQAKNFAEMDDFMLELCDFLKSKSVIDANIHRSILLKGFSRLVDATSDPEKYSTDTYGQSGNFQLYGSTMGLGGSRIA